MGTLLQYNWFLSNSNVTQFPYKCFVFILQQTWSVYIVITVVPPLISPGFRCIEILRYYSIVPFKRGHPLSLYYKATFSLQKWWTYGETTVYENKTERSNENLLLNEIPQYWI